MKREKYWNHFKLYESNMKDPIFTRKLKFPKTEKIISDKNLFLVIAQITSAIKNDSPKKVRLTLKSKLGSENIFLFSQLPAKKFARNGVF